MISYLTADFIQAGAYVPQSILLGAFFSLLLCIVTGDRKGYFVKRFFGGLLFFVYLSFILIYTYIARDTGRAQTLNLTLFSTWGSTVRNNAYFVENILLFIPYGLLASLTFAAPRNLGKSLLLGASTSIFIELLQYVSTKGNFEIDDILTNLLGMVLGYLVARLFVDKKGMRPLY